MEKKNKRKKESECYCCHKELWISHHVKYSLAWNSLFKCIKTQPMQVFCREDEPDCCYSVQIYLNWNSEFCIIWKTANWLAVHLQSRVPFVVLKSSACKFSDEKIIQIVVTPYKSIRLEKIWRRILAQFKNPQQTVRHWPTVQSSMRSICCFALPKFKTLTIAFFGISYLIKQQ